MQYPETSTGPLGPHWSEKEQIVFTLVPLMSGTKVSHNHGIPASAGNLNLVSYIRADGNGNMSSVLTNWKPWYGLSLDSRGLVPEVLGAY